MTAALKAAEYSAPWVDLSGLPAGIDPYARKIAKADPNAPLSKEAWLTIRRTAIGSSDAATVLGENPYKTPFALYQEKIGAWEPDDLSDNEAVEVGIDLEEYCGRKLAERTGRKVRRDNFIRRSAEHPFMLCNVDFDVVAVDGGEPEIAECKTSLGRVAFTDAWGDGPEEVPETYIIQLTHQMIARRRQLGWIPALLAGPRFKAYRIAFRPKLATIIIEAEREFFQRLVDGNPPPVTSLDDAKRAFPKSRSIEVQASVAIVEAVGKLRALKASEKQNSAQIKEIQGVVAGFMADADTLMHGKQRLLTYKTVEKTGYTVAPSSSRTFRLDGQKE